eukprot:gene17612-23945_t
MGRRTAILSEFSSQVETIKNTLSKAAGELSQRTAESSEARFQLDAKRKRLDAARKKHAVMKRKLETEFQSLDSLEEKVAQLESIRVAEEAALKQAQQETDQHKKEQFKRSQKLFALRETERDLISEISGGQGQNKNLASRISTLDEQVVRQKELLYNVEFQLQQMERKKLTIVLEGVNAENAMLLEQVKRSEDDLLKARRFNTGLKTDKNAMLLEQVKRSKDDHLKARRFNTGLKTDKEKLDGTSSTIKLENEMINRQVRTAVESKEKALVDHDILKLEVRRLRDILSMHADEVFSLENRKYQLRMSMEERKQEIEIHRDGLRQELKLIREDVHRITLELKERIMRVEKLQSKYDVLSAKGKSADDDGEPKTQAYYVIKAAQSADDDGEPKTQAYYVIKAAQADDDGEPKTQAYYVIKAAQVRHAELVFLMFEQ